MQVGDGNGEPDSSNDSDTENEDTIYHVDFIQADSKNIPQKIFFTDGGKTNKVNKLKFNFIQSSKLLIDAAAIKKRSKEDDIQKESKCIIM